MPSAPTFNSTLTPSAQVRDFALSNVHNNVQDNAAAHHRHLHVNSTLTPSAQVRDISLLNVHQIMHKKMQLHTIGTYTLTPVQPLFHSTQVTPSLALNFALYDSYKDIWVHNIGPVSAVTAPLSCDSGRRAITSTNDSSSHCRSATPTSKRNDSVAITPTNSSKSDSATSSSSSSSSSSSLLTAQPPSPPSQMTTFGSLACGAAAGFTTSTLTFPLDLMRRRVQVWVWVQGVGVGVGAGCGCGCRCGCRVWV